MAGLVTDSGEAAVLGLLLDGAQAPVAGLFKNDYTPDDATVLSDLIESDFPGYARIDLTTASGPVVEMDSHTKRTKTNCVFTRSVDGTPQTGYGWFIKIKDAGGVDRLYAAGRFDAPALFQVAGDRKAFDLDIVATDLGS